MQWLNIYLPDTQNAAFGCAETLDLGTWFRLMSYCCIQENGGRIRGARPWDDGTWMRLFGIKKAEVDRKSALWTWKNDHLQVHFFPAKQMAQVHRLRQQSASANEVRWGKRGSTGTPDGKPHGNAQGNPQAIPHGTPEGTPERKDKGRIKERKGKESLPSPDGDGQKPSSISDVIAFFATLAAPEPVAREFFLHYQALEWEFGGRARIRSWKSAGEKWVLKSRTLAPQNSSGGGAPADFDPAQPHAHTGGVAVEN